MSTLQQSINARRAADMAALACASVGEPAPALVVAIWQGESWVFPWSHLASVRWEGSEGRERLSFVFTGYVVGVEGWNLRSLLTDIAAFRLGSLRELPSEYENKLSADAPFVSRIGVRPEK